MSVIKVDGEKITLYKQSDDPSDSIDLKKPDVKVKLHIDKNKIEIDLKGQSVDYSVSNAIRLAILTLIPIFRFHRTKLKVEKKESGYSNSYNNDTIETILENTPIYDINHDLDILDPENYLPTEVHKTLYSNFIQEKYEDMKDIETKSSLSAIINKDGTYQKNNEKKKFPSIVMSLTKINTDPIMTIYANTHDAKLTIDGVVSDSYLKRPRIDLFQLRPNESISLVAEAVLGISIMYGIFNATDIAVSIEKDSNYYQIKYKSLGQLKPIAILQKACIILVTKLELLMAFIIDNYSGKIKKEQYVEININGEDHTLGNLISTTLKKTKDVREASYCVPHQLVANIVIQYKLEENSKIDDPIDVFIEVLQYLINIFNSINDQTLKN